MKTQLLWNSKNLF